jgi:hypothetical protein
MSIKIFVTYGDIGKKIQLLPTDGLSELKNKINKEFNVSEPIDLFVINDGNETPILDSTIIKNKMNIIAKIKPVIDDLVEEEEVIRRPRSESISAPSYFLLPIAENGIIAIETSFEDIKERTNRNHGICIKERTNCNHGICFTKRLFYSSSEEEACENWQMRALGITNDDSLQKTILKGIGHKGNYDTKGKDIMEEYTLRPVEEIRLNIQFLLNEMLKIASDGSYSDFAIPLSYSYTGTNDAHSILLIKQNKNIYLYDPSSSKIIWDSSKDTIEQLIAKWKKKNLDVYIFKATTNYNPESRSGNKLLDPNLEFGGKSKKKSQKNRKIKRRSRRSTKRRCRSSRRRRHSRRHR